MLKIKQEILDKIRNGWEDIRLYNREQLKQLFYSLFDYENDSIEKMVHDQVLNIPEVYCVGKGRDSSVVEWKELENRYFMGRKIKFDGEDIRIQEMEKALQDKDVIDLIYKKNLLG
jgi:fructosamine-3-kinase